MQKRLICLASVVLGVWAMANLTHAEVLISYDADATTGGVIQNPSEQGWVETGLGDGVTVEGVVDNGTNAWRVVDDVSNLNPQYTWDVTPEVYQAMYDQGWTYEFVTRGVSAGFTGWGLTTATDPGWGLTTRERVGFGIGVSGNSFSISPIHGNAVVLGPGSASEFHIIRCVGKAQSSEYEFLIDGVSYGTYDIKDGTSNSSFDNVFRFVSGSTAGTDRETLWNFVGLALGEVTFRISPALAANPLPGDAMIDVPRTVTLAWAPGDFSLTHDVYIGTSFDDVNNAGVANPLGVLVAQGQKDTTYEAGMLAFDQTYYWRVDEVNGAPDNTVFKGAIWSFDVEPLAIPITQITATASGSNPNMEPAKTIDGSGLNELDQHSVLNTGMWLTATDGSWIQYEFDGAYKLHEMLVWNSNQNIESFIGFGVKEVVIETSLDGEVWTVVEDVPPFAQAPGNDAYEANTTVDLSGIIAKVVKISPQSAHGFAGQSGLSEVRFLAIPTNPRELAPADGAVVSDIDVTLTWRAGREAATHEVTLGTDPANLSVAATTEENVAVLEDLDYARTYYWQIIEVNEAETPTTYASEIHRFDTPSSGIVDDFESYSGQEGQEIFMVWLDGYGGDASLGGSTTGHIDGPFVETGNVYPGMGGKQSMPVYIDNDGDFFDIDAKQSSPTFSEVLREFDAPQDWTTSGVKTLSIMFSGSIGLTGQLYCKINGTKLLYDGDASLIGVTPWSAWNIDLAGVNGIQSVKTLAIGVEGGSSGVLTIDDIRLYPQSGEMITPKEPGNANLVGAWNFDEGSGTVATDSSGNNRNGTLVDAAWDARSQGYALFFNGAGTHVNIDGFKGMNADRSDPDNPVQRAFSVTGWINTEFDGALVTWGSSNTAGVGGQYQSFRIDGGTLRAEHGNGNYRGATPVSDGEWHHVALAVAAGANLQPPQNQLYVDGLMDALRASGNSQNIYNLTEDADVSIGRRASYNDRHFTGLIDEVRIYDAALSPAEILWSAGVRTPIHKAF